LSLCLSHTDLVGSDITGITQPQLSRLLKAHEAGKGITIKNVKDTSST